VRARLYAAACLALALATTALSVKISYAQRNLSTALAEHSRPGFYSAIAEFLLIIVLAAPTYALDNYAQVGVCVFLCRVCVCCAAAGGAAGAAARGVGGRVCCAARAHHNHKTRRNTQRTINEQQTLLSSQPQQKDRMITLWRAFLSERALRGYMTARAYYTLTQPGWQAPPLPAGGGGLKGGGSGGAAAADERSWLADDGGGGSASGDAGDAGVDNPDQRICQDVRSFVKSSTELLMLVLKKLFSCAAFAGMRVCVLRVACVAV
jgi:ABC-type uncharacterized transport system fused permease/ATPase subunit